MVNARRRRMRVWRLLPALSWLLVLASSAVGASLPVARDARGSQILVAELGDRTPGVRTADPDDPRPTAPPPVVGGASALELEPGFAPWPSPAGAGISPDPWPVLRVAPKTSPPRSWP